VRVRSDQRRVAATSFVKTSSPVLEELGPPVEVSRGKDPVAAVLCEHVVGIVGEEKPAIAALQELAVTWYSARANKRLRHFPGVPFLLAREPGRPVRPRPEPRLSDERNAARYTRQVTAHASPG
jgi:hypothetical protein